MGKVDIRAVRSLLVCGAHPDDETFFAGTMALYARQGVRVSILCGTRGERGATADLCSIEELPRVREAELRASMRVIGLRDEDVFFLPYEDQKLHSAPAEQIREELVRVIRKVRPQVVVSFDPHGGNGHTDHVAMSRFLLDAIPAAGDARWCRDGSEAHIVSRLLWLPPLQPWRLPVDADYKVYPGVDFLIDTTSVANVKIAAISEHRTQLPGLRTLYFEHGSPRLTLNQEVFRLGWGRRPASMPSADLFEELDCSSCPK
jgi:LmbE family N-acetylglucosaminyl deacetylase